MMSRGRWHSYFAFFCACLGSAIGFGNVWRFPYYTFKHGGGIFCLAYGLALFSVGIPMMTLEITLG